MDELKESRFVRKDGSTIRRWFSNESIDLIVWYDTEGEISGFQLCYGRHRDECALTWKKSKGFSHDQIDVGEETPLKNQTPILRSGGSFDVEVFKLFEKSKGSIDPTVSSFVLRKLEEYCDRNKK
jgi:hypothetical protein